MRMPWPLLILAVVALALAARLLLASLPLRSAVRLDIGLAVLVGLGLAGLVGHCAAMFYTDLVLTISGTDSYVDAVNAAGVASRLLYAVPALIMLVGLRRLPVPALAVLVLAFVAVGVTMYDGSAITTHLATILVSVVALTGCLAGWVRLPTRGAGGSATPVSETT